MPGNSATCLREHTGDSQLAQRAWHDGLPAEVYSRPSCLRVLHIQLGVDPCSWTIVQPIGSELGEQRPRGMWVLASQFLSSVTGLVQPLHQQEVCVHCHGLCRCSTVKPVFGLLHSVWAQPWAWLRPCPPIPFSAPVGSSCPCCCYCTPPHTGLLPPSSVGWWVFRDETSTSSIMADTVGTEWNFIV